MCSVSLLCAVQSLAACFTVTICRLLAQCCQRLGKMAHPVKCLCTSRGTPEPITIQGQWCTSVTAALGRQRQEAPGAHWPASRTEPRSSRFRECLSQKYISDHGRQLTLTSGLHPHPHTRAHPYMQCFLWRELFNYSINDRIYLDNK